MYPPHLPPPSCNVESHHRWQRLKIIMAAAFFGLFAGLSGAAMMLGWIWPGFSGDDIWTMTRSRSPLSRSQLEDRVKTEMAARVFTVYAGTSQVGSVSYFNNSNKRGEAAVVSSDGYLAMYFPQFDGNYKNWRVLTETGSVYRLSKALLDRHSGLLYLKIAVGNGAEEMRADEQLKVSGFADKITPLDEVFVYQDGQWRYGWVQDKIFKAGATHLDSAPGYLFSLSGGFEVGSIVISSQGRVVGFIGSDGFLLPNLALTRILPTVLSQGAVAYPTLGVEGWYSEEQPVIVKGEKIAGFLVNRVTARKSALARGDIILEINGYVVTSDNLWYNIGNKSVRLKVLRGAKTLELQSDVTSAD